MSDQEFSKVDAKKHFLQLTVEFGPGAELPENFNHGDLHAFCENHAEGNPGSFLHALMGFLRDHQAAGFESGVLREDKASRSLTITMSKCGECTLGNLEGYYVMDVPPSPNHHCNPC
jgi:hypothetical protein